MVTRKNERIQEEQSDLHSKLKTVLVEVSEANLSATEMGKNVSFKA